MAIIRDNAGGIPEEIIGRVFDPYFTTREEGKGTGIGLYMAKMIVERNMGGRLTVRNTTDGAEFRIELPTTPLKNIQINQLVRYGIGGNG